MLLGANFAKGALRSFAFLMTCNFLLVFGIFFGNEIFETIVNLLGVVFSFLSGLIGLTGRYDTSRVAKKLWYWFEKQAWLHWFAKTENGLLKVVVWMGIVMIPAIWISEWHWLYTHPGKYGWHFRMCDLSWQLVVHTFASFFLFWCSNCVHPFKRFRADSPFNLKRKHRERFTVIGVVAVSVCMFLFDSWNRAAR